MRALIATTLLALSGCSWDPEKPNIKVHVFGIPQVANGAQADHLDVTLTASDSSIQPRVYRPSFQPMTYTELDLDLVAPSPTGTFKVEVVAADRSCPSPCPVGSGLAQGNSGDVPEPAAGAVAETAVQLK